MILISIENHIYDVENYQSKHPGEGISNVYLRNFKNKNVDILFDKYHTSNDSYLMLELAREKGNHNGIYYVCPDFFHGKRIPKYFYFSKEEQSAIKFMNDKPNKTFILTIDENKENSLCISYKEKDQIFQTEIKKIEDKWICNWGNKEEEDICGKNIKEIIEKVMIQNNFEPINI